jgi:hypothetical protein
MTRGSYDTPSLPAPKHNSPPSLRPDEPRTYSWVQYGATATSSMIPTDFPTPALAAELSDKWLEIAHEKEDAMNELLTSIRAFLLHIANQPHLAENLPVFEICDLRRRHLDAWEKDLMAAHIEAQTDTHYRYAIYLFGLLKRIHTDAPHSLHPEVIARLERPTRLVHHRNEGLPAFSENEVRQMRAKAYRIVDSYFRNSSGLPAERDVLIAAHLLLSLATGEPPETIRALTTEHIIATPKAGFEHLFKGLTPERQLTVIAEQDLAEEYAVLWRKNRSKISYQEIYTRQDHAAFQALANLIRLTAKNREETRTSVLWLIRKDERIIEQPRWHSKGYRLRSWNERHHLEISEPQIWARLRKSVLVTEVLADPSRYLRSQRRHTPETFFKHYANSSVLRAQAGRLLLDSANKMFDAAVTGPVIISPTDEQRLTDKDILPSIGERTKLDLLDGKLDGPHAACRNPDQSPYEAPGITCSKSMTGTCFGCSNALITQHHLPAVLAVAQIADPQRAADPQTWLSYWKPIYDSITQHILPAFDVELVEKARQFIGDVPLDQGTLNGMRGINE